MTIGGSSSCRSANVAILQAYERTATTTQPLVAFVSFYRGQVKAYETPPLAVTGGLDARTEAVPLRFSLSVETLRRFFQ